VTSAKKKETRPLGHQSKCRACFAPLRPGARHCGRCKAWTVHPENKTGKKYPGMSLLSEVDMSGQGVTHIPTGPWDPCFGVSYLTKKAGIVAGSVNLVGGVPGAGKSTLSLQLTNALAKSLSREIVYIAAEEDLIQVKERAKRLDLDCLHLIQGISALGGMQTELGALLLDVRPAGIILDSLPGLGLETPEMGVEYCSALKGYAVELNCPIIVIDHATKSDDLAGLLALQHAVDATLVLFVNPDETRTLTPLKNRNGPCDVQVRLLMTEKGLVAAGNEEDEEDDE
jgi:predicted ATP-dependent serine protease